MNIYKILYIYFFACFSPCFFSQAFVLHGSQQCWEQFVLSRGVVHSFFCLRLQLLTVPPLTLVQAVLQFVSKVGFLQDILVFL